MLIKTIEHAAAACKALIRWGAGAKARLRCHDWTDGATAAQGGSTQCDVALTHWIAVCAWEAVAPKPHNGAEIQAQALKKSQPFYTVVLQQQQTRVFAQQMQLLTQCWPR